MNDKPDNKDREPPPKDKDKKKIVRVWPETMKKPPPRYRIEDTNPGD